MKKTLPLLAVMIGLLLPTGATAATISGSVPRGQGWQVVVVEVDGRGVKPVIQANGSFRATVRTVNQSSVHLIRGSGAYYGPVLFGGGGSTVYGTLRGRRSVNLRRIAIRPGYGVAILPNSRVMRSRDYAITARNGRPIGAGNGGRVLVGNGSGPLRGFNGIGRDTDLDGLPGVFDVDDNGNLILDNVDRTGRRGKGRPPRVGQIRQVLPGASEFRMASIYTLTGAQTPNAGAIGPAPAVTVAAQLFPNAFSLATQVVGGGVANLDCLGDPYCLVHSFGEPPVGFPQVNGTFAVEVTDGIVPIANGPTGVAMIAPGAFYGEVNSGDSYLQVVGRTSYPGTLNFAFIGGPALRSFQVGTAAATTLTYQTDGSANRAMDQSLGNARVQMSQSSAKLTLTFWRPQRQAFAGESSARGWVDIGGLTYTVQSPTAPQGSAKNECPADAYSGFATTNRGDTPEANPDGPGMLDTARDAAAASANTLSMTIDLTKCFNWGDIPSGTLFRLDLHARSLYGDDASRAIYIRKNT